MYKIYLLIAAFLLVPVVHIPGAQAEFYKWTDEEGNTVFSDQPHEGAERIKQPQIQTYTAPSIKPPRVIEKISPKTTAYEQVSITSPQDQQTLRSNSGNVSVSAKILPKLELGHLVRLYVDGKPHGKPGPRTVWQLHNLDRGTHTVRIAVLDSNGKKVTGSGASTFHILRFHH